MYRLLVVPAGCVAAMMLSATTASAAPTTPISARLPVGTVLVSDSGNQRVLALAPDGGQSTVGTNLSVPFGVAADPAGNVLIGDMNNQVVKVAPDGSQSIVAFNASAPYGVASDAAGDALVTDFFGDRIVKIAPGGTRSTVGTDLHHPSGVTIDAAGDVLISNYSPSSVVKVAPDGTQTLVTSDLHDPYGVTVDAAGDVIIADGIYNRVVKVTPDGTQTTIGTDLDFPTGVAVDAAGDVLIAEYGGGRLTKVAPDGTQTTVLSGLINPFGVAVVLKQPQTIHYASTAPTHARIGDTYTVTATGGGSGNPVTFTRNAASTRYCTVSNDGENSATVTFTGHGYCAVFAHQAGNADYPRAAVARQLVYVYKLPQAITFTSTPPSHARAGGDNYTVTATGGGSRKPVTFTRSAASTAQCTVLNDGPNTATVTFTAPGTCTVYARQARTAIYAAAKPVAQHIHAYPAA